MSNEIKTAKQQEILDELNKRFGIDPERILFINARDQNDPWIPPDELMSIARQHGGFKLVSVTHDKFVGETAQQIYTATVVDALDRTFVRSGVATLGEKPNGQDIDTETLASGRALGAALRDAGFHPYKSGSIVNLDAARQHLEERNRNRDLQRIEDEAALRTKDLKQIHALAGEKGLIVGNNYTAYRLFLSYKFGTLTVVGLDAATRAQVINALNNYTSGFADAQDEFGGEAMAA
jgi:hypothetical protein